MIYTAFYFLPPCVFLAVYGFKLCSDKKAFFESKENGVAAAVLVPFYPLIAIVFLQGIGTDSGMGVLAGIFFSVIYYPVMFVLLAVYTYFAKYRMPVGIATALCSIPIIFAFFGGLAGVGPH